MSSTVPDDMIELRLALGVRRGESSAPLAQRNSNSGIAMQLQANLGITDRLQWLLPTIALAYRGGNADKVEWIPWGGLVSWALAHSDSTGIRFEGTLAAGLDLTTPLAKSGKLIFGLGLGSEFWLTRRGDDEAPTTLRTRATAGYSHTFKRVVTLTFSGRYSQNVLEDGSLPDRKATLAPRVAFGSVQDLALRSLPLVKVHLGDVTSLDAYAAVDVDLVERSVSQSYLLGATFIW